MVVPTPDYFDEGYYQRGGLYENKLIMWRPRAKWLVRTFEPVRVLEIGSGEGCLLLTLQGMGVDVVGIDISRYGSYFYRRNRVLGSDVFLPFRDGSFDLVCGFDIMEHNLEEDIPALVAELGRVCSREGFFNVALVGQTDDKVDPTHYTLKPRPWWEEKFGTCFEVAENRGDCPTLNFQDAQFTLRRKN